MSDPVAIAIIVAVQGIFVAWFTNRKGQQREARTNAAILETKVATTAAIQETKAAVESQKDVITTLEKNTNSIKDALIESTAREKRAQGNLEGRAELKEERRRAIDEIPDQEGGSG